MQKYSIIKDLFKWINLLQILASGCLWCAFWELING